MLKVKSEMLKTRKKGKTIKLGKCSRKFPESWEFRGFSESREFPGFPGIFLKLKIREKGKSYDQTERKF